MPGTPAASGGAPATWRRPQAHSTSCRSYWVVSARASGRSVTWWEYATPRSRAPASSRLHSHRPPGNTSSVLSGRGSHARYAPGAPGCLPGFRLFPPPRALRCGGFFPGRSSDEGGIEEFPLLRDSARSSRLTCSRSAAIWSACALTASRSSPISSCCAAICSSRAAQAAQSGAGGGRADTGHDHQEPAGSKQADTPSRPAEAGQTISSAASHLNIRRRHGGLNVYTQGGVA